MNYRHVFHAGNHTEVFKHAVLSLILEHLLQKPKAFAVLDTHGGLGVYDLLSDEATRTNERSGGVDKIFGKSIVSAPMYQKALETLNEKELNTYPGSPEIVRGALREADRLVVCELHPADSLQLKERYREDNRISVHQRDGYGAIKAMLPLVERRGLVFIDPPFEAKNESDRIAQALKNGHRKWSTGIYAIWYPIKDAALGERIFEAARDAGFEKTIRAEFCPFQRDGITLAGSGIVVCNPPWTLDERLKSLCKELVPMIGMQSSTWSVEANHAAKPS